MTVAVEDHGAVRVLTIDRQDRRNALTTGIAETLCAELRRAESDSNIGSVVLTGAGSHFSAGGDAEEIVGVTTDPEDAAPMSLMRTFHRLVEAVWDCELPVVAAVAGIAYGGGFNLALACDLIVCAEDARFCQVFLRRGVVPDMGGAYLLPKLVGMQRAKELMLLTPEIDARRAEQLGLVNAVVTDAAAAREHAVELAARLADGPGYPMSMAKRLLNGSVDGSLHSALELEAAVQTTALRTPTTKHGFESFLAGRRSRET